MNKIRILLIPLVALILMAVGSVTAQDQVQLVYWSMWNEPEGQAVAIQGWIDAFQAEHPNISISAVWNGRQNQTLVRTALAGGTVIDFMDQDADQVAGGLMREGLGVALDDYLEQTALDEDVPLREVFLPGTLELFELDGSVYLLPYIYNTFQFFYDKRVFEEVGVTVPTTWDEFLAVNDALRGAGYVPLAMENDGYIDQWLTYVVSRLKGPGFLLAAIEDPTGEAWRDPAFLQAAQMERSLWERGDFPEEALGYIWPQGQQTLAFGESAMELVGSWLPIELASATDPEFNWGAYNFPEIEGGVGSVNDLHAALLSFMILKDSQHPDEVFEFLKFIMTKENQQRMADDSLIGVTRIGVPWPSVLADAATSAANAETLFGDIDGAQALHAEYVTVVLHPLHRSMFLGEMTPEAWIEEMVTQSADYWATHS
jgi:ABC-type glycerol-3-phosphate transport system substrate-binding protein